MQEVVQNRDSVQQFDGKADCMFVEGGDGNCDGQLVVESPIHGGEGQVHIENIVVDQPRGTHDSLK